MNKIFSSVYPGIRGKLSIFVGVFLVTLVSVTTSVFIKRQGTLLQDSFEKEVSPFLSIVNSPILENYHLAESLLKIDAWKARIKKKKKESLSFATKEEGVLFKTKKTVTIRSNKYYTQYFDEMEADDFESRIKQQLVDDNGKPLDENELKKIKTLPKKTVIKEEGFWIFKNKKVEHQTVDTRESRAAVKQKEKNYLRKKIESTLKDETKQQFSISGLNLKKYRIQSLDAQGKIRFDTSGIETKSEINKLNTEKEEFRSELDLFLTSNDNTGLKELEPKRFDHDTHQANIRPLFKDPSITERSIGVYKAYHSQQEEWKRYWEEDDAIIEKIQSIVNKLKPRYEALKKEKPDSPPSQDPEVKKLYKEYRGLLSEQNKAFQKYNPWLKEISLLRSEKDRLQEILIKQKKLLKKAEKSSGQETPEENEAELTESRLAEIQNKLLESSSSEDAKISDSIDNLRDAYLFSYSFLGYRNDFFSYNEFFRSDIFRANETQKWKQFRDWVISGTNETMPQGMKPVNNMVLIYSRREAEEKMWENDTSSLLKLSDKILKENTVGYTRVLIDYSDYRNKLQLEKSSLIDISFSIGIRMLFLMFLLSGVLVSRIQRIIEGAKSVGSGNLHVKFEKAGSDELGTLTDALNTMVVGLKEREEMQGELLVAEEIQKRLMPEELPNNMEGFLTFGTFYKAMSGVGGDYYDIIGVGKDEIAICVADVSNHGVGPAIIMATMRSLLHSLVRKGNNNPAKILEELNDQIFDDTPPGIFITVFLGIYNKSTNELRYVSAGHNLPYVYRHKTQTVEVLAAGGMPVAAVESELFVTTLDTVKITLQPGDLFFQYTDGLNEAMDGNQQLFGNARIEEFMEKTGIKKPSVLVTDLARQVEEFTGKQIFIDGPSKLNDDIAMVMVRRVK
ncbi:MAG: SpoIIE family protein phosphatase [Leptospira sp.]|nr:SpoIIE family protein phosphatase [Leptospira sp.]